MLFLIRRIQELFVLLGLFVQTLQNLIDVGIAIRVYLGVVLLQQILGIGFQLSIDTVVIGLVTGFARDHVNDHMSELVLLLRGILYEYGRAV